MRLGQIELLLNAVAQSNAKPLATTKGDQRLGQLVTGAVRVLPRVEESGQALQSVWLGPDRQRRQRTERAEQQQESEQPDAAEEQHAGGRAQQHHGGAKVRLDNQQAGHGPQHHEGFDKAEPGLFDLILTMYQVACQKDHGKQLGQFRGLDVDRANTNPAPAAVHLTTNARDQYRHQQGKAEEQQQEAETLPHSHRHRQGHRQRTQANQQINDLTVHVVQRAAKAAGGDFHRR